MLLYSHWVWNILHEIDSFFKECERDRITYVTWKKTSVYIFFIRFKSQQLWPSALMSDARYKREERRELKAWELSRCSVTYYGWYPYTAVQLLIIIVEKLSGYRKKRNDQEMKENFSPKSRKFLCDRFIVSV